MDNKELLLDQINLEEKELISRVFKAFNSTIEKLRKFQSSLEDQVQYLTRELNTRNREMQNILESLPNGLVVTDLTGNIRNFNRSAEIITGKVRDEVIGNNVNTLFNRTLLPPEDEPNRFKKIEQDDSQTVVHFKSDEIKQILDISTTLMHSDDSDGSPEGIILNIRDITLLKRLEEEAERKNRLTAMGEIAANVAHEIRNPLGSIELFVSTLKLDFQDNDDQMEILNHILTGVRSMNHIISNMLGYAKPRPIVPVKLNLHAILKEFIGFSGHLAANQEVELEAQFNETDSNIKGDMEMLRQVLHNIFTNALQSMPDGGRLAIVLDNITESAPSRVKLFKESAMRLPETLEVVRIMFKDEGKGMTPEVKRRIFDPFFTTKEKGTGLGMFIIRNIINSHNGVIDLDSELGKGTTITVSFPVIESGWRED